MNKEDQKQRLYNHAGVLLVVGIMVGTGLLLIKNSDEKKEPIKIIEAGKDEQVKGVQTTINSKININTATLEELDKLEGVGPLIAQKVIDYRTQNGPFKVLEDLKNVSGIGDAKLANIIEEISL